MTTLKDGGITTDAIQRWDVLRLPVQVKQQVSRNGCRNASGSG
jgi:hypothetical protein